MKIALYPGSFDPITKGHLDIIIRAAKVFDKLVIGVLNNPGKNPLFTVTERAAIIKEATKKIANVEVGFFSGLTVQYAKQLGATVIVRGLRATTDFEYELQLSQTNHQLDPDVDTMFFTTSVEYAYLSSTTVKEVAHFQGPYESFVPDCVVPRIQEKMKERQSADGDRRKQYE